ncbi:MAG: hypothetical protein Q8O78_10960 [Candidatus Deferrimicrobium sp.]|nr:hypothetical protein [Candidatus Deferrimicrobium sp.]
MTSRPSGPSPEDFKEMLRKVHKEARQSGMKKRDVEAAVRKVRAAR